MDVVMQTKQNKKRFRTKGLNVGHKGRKGGLFSIYFLARNKKGKMFLWGMTTTTTTTRTASRALLIRWKVATGNTLTMLDWEEEGKGREGIDDDFCMQMQHPFGSFRTPDRKQTGVRLLPTEIWHRSSLKHTTMSSFMLILFLLFKSITPLALARPPPPPFVSYRKFPEMLLLQSSGCFCRTRTQWT